MKRSRKCARTVNPLTTAEVKTHIITTQKPTAEVEGSAFDYSQVIVGAIVEHSKFGDGKIVKIDNINNRVHINFAFGEKMFILETFERGIIKLK